MEFLYLLGVGIAGIVFGSWQQNNIWISKAKSGFRKECRGELYIVRKDTGE